MYMKLYNPDDVRRALGDELNDDPGYDVASFEPAPEVVRRTLLKNILADPRGGRRECVEGSATLLDRLDAIADRAPHLHDVLGIVQRATKLSMRARTALWFPPLCLVGAAGTGKTWVAEQIAGALDLPLGRYSFASGDDSNAALTGRSLTWRSSRIGGIANLLLNGVGNPVFFLDEIDKAASFRDEDPLDPLHSVLDRTNAQVFSDAYLEFPIRADAVNWILTANEIRHLRPSLTDRMLIVKIEAPTGAQQRRVLQSIVTDVLRPYSKALRPIVTEAVIDILSQLPPRKARRTLELAAGFAVSDGRRALEPVDIEAARRIEGPKTPTIGFGLANG